MINMILVAAAMHVLYKEGGRGVNIWNNGWDWLGCIFLNVDIPFSKKNENDFQSKKGFR